MIEYIAKVAEDPAILTAYATVVMCIVTAFMTIATCIVAKANRQMIKAGEIPKVVVFLDFNPMPIEAWKFDIVLANIGQGPARDVSFEFDHGDNDLCDEQPHIKILAITDDMYFEWIPQGHKVILGSIYHNPDNLPSPCKARVKYLNIHGKSAKDETYSLNLTNKKGIGVMKGWRRPLFEKISDTLTRIENHLSRFNQGA